jgi:hypothetical protein
VSEPTERRPDRWDHREAVEKALGDSRVIGGRSAPADRRALRGLPMIGGAAGEIPGTRPDRNRRLDGWRPKDR